MEKHLELRGGDRVPFGDHVARVCFAVCEKMGSVALGFSLMARVELFLELPLALSSVLWLLVSLDL